MLFDKRTYLALFILWLFTNLIFNEMMFYLSLDEFTYILIDTDKLYFITRYGLIIIVICAELLVFHIKKVLKVK